MDIKNQIISLIILLGINERELIFDLTLDKVTFNSIEWRKKSNQIILHKFNDDYDYEFNYDELPNDIKREIYQCLLKLSVIS